MKFKAIDVVTGKTVIGTGIADSIDDSTECYLFIDGIEWIEGQEFEALNFEIVCKDFVVIDN